MNVKVMTFNKLTGDSEFACLDSKSDFPIKDAIKRLVSDNELNEVAKTDSIHNKHSISYFESEYWRVIVTI